MIDWWSARNVRERGVLLVGALVLAWALTWAFWWQPMGQRQERLAARSVALERSLAQLEEARTLRAAGAGQATAASAATGSLPVRVERGLRMAGLAAAIRSIQPAGETAVAVTLEGASFDALVGWLQQAAASEGVRTTQARIDRATAPGAVNARLELSGTNGVPNR